MPSTLKDPAKEYTRAKDIVKTLPPALANAIKARATLSGPDAATLHSIWAGTPTGLSYDDWIEQLVKILNESPKLDT